MPSTLHGLPPTPPPATSPTSLHNTRCRPASLHLWRRRLPPPPVPTTASCPYRRRPSHPLRPRSRPAVRRPPRCRRSPKLPTSATTVPSCASRRMRRLGHSLPLPPPHCASSSATVRRRWRWEYLPRMRGVPPRAPGCHPATYRPSLSTRASSLPRWMPPPTSLVAASLRSVSPPSAPALRSRVKVGAPRTSSMGAASASTSRAPPTMVRRLFSINRPAPPHDPACTPPCIRLHTVTPPPARPNPTHLIATLPSCLPALYSPAHHAPCRLTCTSTLARAYAPRQAASWVAATRLSPANRAARGTTRPRSSARQFTPFATRPTG